MKLSFAALLCFLFPTHSQGIFPLRELLTRMTSANAVPLDASIISCDVHLSKAKALLTTVPIERSFSNVLNKVVSSKRFALDTARALTSIKFSSVLSATSPTQWAMLLSSMAPVSSLETIVGAILGKTLSLEQQDMLRAILQEYRVLARVAVTSMSLPPQYAKAVWITYAATRALPQRSVLSLMVSAVALLRGDQSLQVFSLSQFQVSALLTGIALLPILFYGMRSVGSSSYSQAPRFVLSDCLLSSDEQIFQFDSTMVLSDTTTELHTSLASVPLKRLIDPAPTTDLFMDNRYTKPAIQLWRIGTSVQFWQSIYHAVKQDEYYCLVEDEQEPVAIA